MSRYRARSTILHFTGYGEDAGGVLSYIRAASRDNGARNILVVGRDFQQRRKPAVPLLRVARMDAESLYHPATTSACFFLAIRFHRLLKRHPHLIFHGHSRAGLIIAQWLNFWGHGRSVATVHANGRHRWFYRWMTLLLGERLSFLCPSMKRYYGLSDTWRGCFPGAPLNPPQFHPRHPGPRLRLGGVGALVRWKRWHLVLKALAMLPEALRERVSFVHAGGATADADAQAYAGELRQMTETLGLAHCVTWTGPQEDLGEFYEGLDVLVVASRNEPWGLVMLEALFAGVPVLAAASGGPTDVIRDGENGYLFTDGDPGDLAKLVSDLLRGEKRLPVIQPEPLEAFSLVALGRKWRRFYEKVLSEA